MVFGSSNSFAGNCEILGRFDTIEKGICLSEERDYQIVLERYKKNGTSEEVNTIIQSENDWIKYRSMVCDAASRNVYDRDETIESCYQWLSEKRGRYYRARFFLDELDLPKCIAQTDSIPNDGGGGGYELGDEVISRAQCEEKCKPIHESAKKYDIWGYCSFGKKTKWTYIWTYKYPKPYP